MKSSNYGMLNLWSSKQNIKSWKLVVFPSRGWKV